MKAQELVLIKYAYCYTDDHNGNYEDVLYTRKNEYLDYENNQTIKNIIENYFYSFDKSRVFKSVISVKDLGKRLLIEKELNMKKFNIIYGILFLIVLVPFTGFCYMVLIQGSSVDNAINYWAWCKFISTTSIFILVCFCVYLLRLVNYYRDKNKKLSDEIISLKIIINNPRKKGFKPTPIPKPKR